jgi:hypothetical protein
MVKSQIDVATRYHDYGSSQIVIGLESPPPLETPLHIKNPKPMSHILKGVLKLSAHNHNARVAQNYSIVEYMGQTPCVMSALEVLQTCPSQRSALLSSLGSLDSCGSKVIKLDVMDVKPFLPYDMAFQIHVEYIKIIIKRTAIDEGDVTCVMSLTYWKDIGSLTLSQSMTMLIAFDGSLFHPYGIFPAFLIHLGGKTVEVDVEVVDEPLDYNLLLGNNWTYAMTAVVSSVFHTLCFPREGKIVTIDQLSLTNASTSASVGPSIHVINNSQKATKDVCVGMYSSLMGTFDFIALIHHIYVISSESLSSMRSIPFCNSYFNNPWTLPSPTVSCEGHSHIGMEMPLSVE